MAEKMKSTQAVVNRYMVDLVAGKCYQCAVDDEGVELALPVESRFVVLVNDSEADAVYVAVAADGSAAAPAAPGAGGSVFAETPFIVLAGESLDLSGVTVGSIGCITAAGKTVDVRVLAWWESDPDA